MKKSVKHLILVLAFCAGPLLSLGQDFLPALNDNYMGINQALLQPASIADSRFKSDWNIGGFSNDIYNDAMRFRSRWLLYPTTILTNDDWWDENTYLDKKNGSDKNVFMSQSAVGPGFLATLSPKHAIGFTSRVRSILNIDGMDEPLFRLIYSNYQEQEFYNKWYYDRDMRSVQHVFGDYGLTYARIIPMPSPEHFLKAGITVKLLQGIASSYLQTDELYYYFNGEDYPGAKNMSFNSPYVNGGLSDNWGDPNEYGSYTFSMNYQLTAKPSVGMDFGVVYEFRPKNINYSFTKYDTTGIERPDKNKYFLKVGVSVLDLGRLKYEKDYYSADYIAAFTPDYLSRYNSGDNSVPVNTYWLNANDVSYSYRDYPDFSYEMHQRSLNGEGIQKATGNKENYTVRLPSAISLQADLNLFLEGLYVNVTTYHALNKGYSNVPSSHYISTYSITPRYEHKWYGVSLPIVINQYGKVDVGLGARVGVAYFGVNNLFSNVFKDTYGIHAYVGVKVPIHHKDPTRPPKEKKPKQVVVCCPCCDCTKLPDKCKMCCQVSRDTCDVSKMECIPGSIQINANHSQIHINSHNVTNPAPSGYNEPVEQPVKDTASGSGGGSGGTGGSSGGPAPGDSEVYFDFNSFKIRPDDLAIINEFVEYLSANPDAQVQISGFTDSIDTDEYNIKLSRNRAMSVYNYMVQKGVKPGQIIQDWKGESNPKGDNNTPEGRQKNRRVEIILLE